MSSVVPEQPFRSIEDRKWLVASVMIPFVFSRPDDWIGGQPFPATDAVARASDSNLRVIDVAEPDVKHQVPTIPLLDLAGGDFMPFPRDPRIRLEYGIGW